MAAKKNLFNTPYTYQDMFDTAQSLDEGGAPVIAGQKTTTTSQRTGLFGWGGNESQTTNPTNVMASTSNQLGSILGTANANAISANKKRRLEQTNAKGNGVGTSQSILGGGAF